jgi:hypothetical protein
MMARRLALAGALVVGVTAALPGTAAADHPFAVAGQPPTLPANDLNNLLALTGYPTPLQAPLQHNPEPPLEPVPRAECGPGSRPLAGEQGRVPASAIDSPEASRGWTCNVEPVGHYGGTPGGFRVWRYVDLQGNACAFYDSSLPSRLNVVRLAAGPSTGVVVLDMNDPARPIRTAVLDSLPMLTPHESLNLNARRGLLAANMGNGTTLPGVMSIYDVSQDCRHPRLAATYHAARFGHESGFSPDGKTYWIGGGNGIAAIDVTDPTRPRTLWDGNVYAHGLSVSSDGNRLYDADPINGNLVILDVSEIQARKPDPEVREVSRLTWDTVSVPQNTAPMTIDGRRYLLEFDEFAFRFTTVSPPDTVGAARIIDIADEAHPRVVSNLRLEVNQPAAHNAANSDPSPMPTPQFTYSAHYCAIPREVDPEIAACSFINSGLRIFDIRDPLNPREVAYYISPPARAADQGAEAADFAMSQPAFDPARREVWYSDASSGFYALKLSKSVWPASGACLARRSPIGPRNIGRIRIGYTRRRLLRLPVAPLGRTRHSFRYCVKGRTGLVRAAFSRRSRRVELVATTAPGHGNRGVRVGSRTARFARAYPGRRRIARGLLRAGPRSPRLIGLRAGRVRFIAVARPGLVRRPRLLRRALRRAGLR